MPRCRAGAGLPHTTGCYIAESDLSTIFPGGRDGASVDAGGEPIIPQSGDRNFDFALAHTLAKLTQAFEVLPGFAYYDDTNTGQNAFATPVVRMQRPDGTVLFGRNLLRKLRRESENPEVGIAGVCAHEFAHILQFKYGLYDKVNAGQTNVRRTELQADWFAGYFAGIRKRERRVFPAAVVALAIYSLGDNNVSSPGHHGTQEERGAAVVKGFEASFRDRMSLSDAIARSTAYVQAL